MKTIIKLTPTDIDIAIRMYLEKYHNSHLDLQGFDFEYHMEGEGRFPFNQVSLTLTDKYPPNPKEQG